MLGPALLKKKKNQTWIQWSFRKTTMGGWISLLFPCFHPNPWNLWICYLIWQENPEMRLSCIIWVGPVQSQSPSKGDAKGSQSEGEDVKAGADVRDKRCYVPGLQEGERGQRGPGPRNVVASTSQNRKEIDSPREPPGGMLSSWHILDFWPPGLQDNKFVASATKFLVTVTAKKKKKKGKWIPTPNQKLDPVPSIGTDTLDPCNSE